MRLAAAPLALSLLALPGAWLAFGLPLRGSGVRARAALAVALTPLVLAAQFYLLRAVGVPFGATAWSLALVNLPALALVARRARGARLPDARGAALWAAMLALPALYIGMWLHDAQRRANISHGWMHAGIVYELAAGALRPEEPELAGVRLAYPWLGHVPQSVVSYLLDGAPAATYLVANLVWLAAVVVLVAELVARLGGDRLAQATSAAWLCFAVNVGGLLWRAAAPVAVQARLPIGGDSRYMPWLRKFAFFQQTVIGIALVAALAYALTRPPGDERDRGWLALAALLLLSTALFYPVLFPAAAAVAGARLLVLLARRWREPAAASWGPAAALALALAAAAAATAGFVALVGADRAGEPAVALSTTYQMKLKTATALLALAPLLAGLAVVARRLRRAAPEALAVLALGALGSVLLYAAFDVRNWRNEYKYMFTAAVLLTPFPALAVARGAPGRWRAPVAIGLALLLAVVTPPGEASQDPGIWPGPALDVRDFAMRLAPSEPLAGVTDAIRERSAPGAVVVSRAAPFDLVALTRRPMYVPYDTASLHGLGINPDYLLKRSRGYDPALVDARRGRVRALYAAAEAPERERLVAAIARELGRPVVVVARRREDSALAASMAAWPAARPLFASPDVAAWQVDPRAAPPAAVHASSDRP